MVIKTKLFVKISTADSNSLRSISVYADEKFDQIEDSTPDSEN